MAGRLLTGAPRVISIVVVALFATATLTFAATQAPTAPKLAAPTLSAPDPAELVVPDVRRQAYVFAKGSLEQAGFAWQVAGSVQGYPANTVAEQVPAPGARVVADGTPVVVLRLVRNPAYKQEGLPENASPYAGKPARLLGATPKRAAVKPAVAVAKPKPAKAAPKPKPKVRAPAKARPAAFAVPGAPAEPLDELTLPERARRLAAWVEARPQPNTANADHWLYQHNWIVTGARFGWSGGAEALRTLVKVDERVQQLWGVGARSEELARRTLAEVEASAR